MSTNTDFDKIDKVLSKITGKELKSFVRIYSYTHDDFATALVEKILEARARELQGDGRGMLCPCGRAWQAIRRARLGLEEDREGLAGCDEKSGGHSTF